ncbi:hypothetical protein O7606_24565 [Micromonospora sp. WMMD882]|uniref:hypothetical protein n=1 Tax=Micromonospora sp. WMMD882 TaxID=3015151 RepID=UPI00248CE563|nr:hypothetical protein [Micromonospora sp. WMMD882]WBB79306.1 hypothetical protein O7606_24565 [Micromonospora sp. WMMD882]
MSGLSGGWSTVVDCPTCAGLTCLDGVRCRDVAGSSAQACAGCGGYGKRRAQLVLTVANLDTGAVASLNVVPGSVPPTPTPDGVGWELALAPLVAELADAVGVPPPPAPPTGSTVPLPSDFTPYVTPELSRARVATAIVGRAYPGWWVHLGRGVPSRPASEPANRSVRRTAAGRPGARLVGAAVAPETPALATVIRLAVGLGLELAVGVLDQRYDPEHPSTAPGRWWTTRIVPPGTPDDRIGPPGWPSAEAALAFQLRYLDDAVTAAVPADPTTPVGVPQTAPPLPDLTGGVDPVAACVRLAGRYPQRPVLVRFDADGCRVHLRKRDGYQPLARGGTLAAALAALGLRPPGTANRDREA